MLCWNVFYGNINSKKIETFNVFDHSSFYKDCVKAKKKYSKDREAFTQAVRTSLMYYFWSKCEWEVIIQHWPPCERYQDAKIDVYDQVSQNFDIFMDYLWSHLKELK